MAAILAALGGVMWFAYGWAAAAISVGLAALSGLASVGLYHLVRRPEHIPTKIKLLASVISGVVGLASALTQMFGVHVVTPTTGPDLLVQKSTSADLKPSILVEPAGSNPPDTPSMLPSPSATQPKTQSSLPTTVTRPPQPTLSPAGFSGNKDLNNYCKQHLGYAEAFTSKGNSGAYENWVCRGNKPDQPYINFLDACKWAHGPNVDRAEPTNAGDPYTWVCYVRK